MLAGKDTDMKSKLKAAQSGRNAVQDEKDIGIYPSSHLESLVNQSSTQRNEHKITRADRIANIGCS